MKAACLFNVVGRLLVRSRPAVTPRGTLRLRASSTIPPPLQARWQSPLQQPLPQVLRVSHYDLPAEACPLKLQNTLTGKPNFLREVQLEFLFCTLLSVQDPSGTFHHLMGAYWNVRWRYTFDQPGYKPTLKSAGTGAYVSPPFRGDPRDGRFAPVLTSVLQIQNCNDLARAAQRAFNVGAPNRHESGVWTDYHVTAR
jgi:hypothetical protein